ncbi:MULTISPECIES: 23S rRNA (adenine(2503)-C(2))-methyltransferase RlmN [Thermoanaerobacterium]|uniref:Probable dual-specificity RNA methyltransferase RlmN n=1 Tax=Thermoanaerobacterium butyriciformans TaxID=1702242 RepID=A0ABS4NFP1_9THEO|nr:MULTISPECIES: 23S rRNA (adenine(2503)-C(2))-methyltransferase RlmN [Thermoanaerobacterium]MBE0068317.1 23S rRNA (adenine(2503)-C(2))-methyltransferase RlmN [Thermoanaerobacterium thermosaccharolyticum]MBE0228181.1 23S rRNA (adenine(2503)-C(2))-methyltransferase RlmN [Thermoanaerobacterium thermosaccharolyticum]MBP2072489.1 23S rRNA (adenine2503-C2)-methyltransferase [Thermoanaerobacterium butyriciformans]MCP2240347.1 23S rRNA (adenine2503-C2)-methyltransferase [Thermoanaerobacterium thermosa
MVDLKNMTIDELEKFFIDIGETKYRAKQVFQWIYRGVTNFDDMTDLKKELRQKLKNIAYISSLKIARKLVSDVDETAKYLFLLEDENIVEGVAIKYSFGNTSCISTQVGCNMKCSFCASGIEGKARNLNASEMVDEVLIMNNDYGKISNIVLMGSGEPFDNYDEVMKFIKIVNNPFGMSIGIRHITISTCGIVPKIYDFANEGLGVNLSISLHAPTDDLRTQLMPINKVYPIKDLIKACKYYIDKTHRRVTFEYSLIKDVNDSYEMSVKLSKLLKGLLCHVNLIPINYVGEIGYKKADNGKIMAFKNTLEENGITCTVRRELGSDIDAACGQLRRKYLAGRVK